MILQHRGLNKRSLGSARTRRVAREQVPFMWLNYNAASGFVHASHNVSSLTDNGTGDMTVAFTLLPLDGKYAMTSAGLGTGVYRCDYVAASATTGFTQTVARLVTYQTDSVAADVFIASVIGIGRR